MAIGHRPFGQKMTTVVETTCGVQLAKVSRKINLSTTGANSFSANGYTYSARTIQGQLKFKADSMSKILAWVESLFPQYTGKV